MSGKRNALTVNDHTHTIARVKYNKEAQTTTCTLECSCGLKACGYHFAEMGQDCGGAEVHALIAARLEFLRIAEDTPVIALDRAFVSLLADAEERRRKQIASSGRWKKVNSIEREYLNW